MIKHFSSDNMFEIRGASIFIVIDHEKDDYICKLIDIGSVECVGHRDEGFLLGLNNAYKKIFNINKLEE